MDPIPPLAPIITTGNASNVMNTTATVSLSITDVSKTKEIGVLYGSSSAILTSSDAQKGIIANLKPDNDSISLAGLLPGTTYYYKAFATDGYASIYGDMKTFTTGIDYPLLTTNSVRNITSTQATCGGNISSSGGGNINARGVCWSTASSPTIANSKTTDGTGMGTFTSLLTGLSANTNYYVRAYVTNEKGTAYGAQVNFTTLPISLPTLITTSVSSITATTAISGGNITNDGGALVKARGVCWSTTSNPTTANGKTADGIGTGTFTSSITGLISGNIYYVRAYATNSAGTVYGSPVSFMATDTLTINGYTLTQNETWSGIILLKGDIVVPSGITLTINPGTIINISANTPVYDGGMTTGKIDFNINGSLIINGNAQNIVQLKSAASSPQSDDWFGIWSGNQLKLTYCYLSDAEQGVNGYATTAMNIKNCCFNNMIWAISDDGSVKSSLSNNSFVNVSNGYESWVSNKNAQLDYSEFKNNTVDVQILGTLSTVTNNASITVNYSNFSGNKLYNLDWSWGGVGSITNSNITANYCYGITSYLNNGNGNTYTYTNQLSNPYSGAGCGFSSMAKSPASRSSVIGSNEQIKRTLQEHNERISQQYEKMKHKRIYEYR